jgi:TetR/AcrR family transcriptional regulator
VATRPSPTERRRDPERTRRAILDAATEEFAGKGFAGARVAEIARRAGVNPQLISYYFGGKQGLHDALRDQWLAGEADLTARATSFGEMVDGYLAATLDRPAQARMLLRGELDGPGGDVSVEHDGVRSVSADIEDLRRRQEVGELTDEFSPELIRFIMQLVMLGPVALPGLAEACFGLDPASPEFRARYGDEVRRLFTRAEDRGSEKVG